MALSSFDDRSAPPTAEALAQALGPSMEVWRLLKKQVAADWPPVVEEWTYAGRNYGWSLRLKRDARAILYLTPGHASFLASFVLGEKACAHAAAMRLPRAIREAIDAAPRYPEGRGVRIQVRGRRDLPGIRALTMAKMAR